MLVRTLVGLLAALVLLAGAGTASATRLSVSTERLTWTGSTTFVTEGSPLGEITCNITFLGTLSRTFAKVVGGTVGGITESRITECVSTEGRPTVRLLRLPRLTFRLFVGTLPRIVNLLFLLKDVEILIETPTIIGTLRCLYRGDLGLIFTGTGWRYLEEPGALRKVTAELTSVFCPEGARALGAMGVRPVVTLSLI